MWHSDIEIHKAIGQTKQNSTTNVKKAEAQDVGLGS